MNEQLLIVFTLWPAQTKQKNDKFAKTVFPKLLLKRPQLSKNKPVKYLRPQRNENLNLNVRMQHII